MNFIERFKNGWRLLIGSLGVLRRNKTLLLFPLATAALTIVMGVLFLTPIALQSTGHSYSDAAHWKAIGSQLFTEEPATGMDAERRGDKTKLKASPVAIAYFMAFYFLSMFLATFFNVAFVHEVFDALEGKSVSVAEGLQFASSRIKSIFLWSMFAGVVGLLIKSLEEKFGLFGQWVVRFIGLAWSVAAVFVVPVLVMEEHSGNPIDIMRQSANVIRKTWGEALGGYAGLQIGQIIGILSMLVVIPASFYLGFAYQRWGLMLGGMFGWLAFMCAFSYVLNVAGQIYLCMLYRYASTGVVPEGFTPELLNLAWKPKKA